MIAGLIGGTIEGNPDAKVNNFAKIEEGKPGCISFLANDKYEHYIYETQSSVVLVNNNFEPKKEVSATLIRVPDAREAVAKLLQAYESMKRASVTWHSLTLLPRWARTATSVPLSLLPKVWR